VVLVTDDKGSAVAGVSVTWAAQGGGSVSSNSVKTGTDGRASVERTLGPAAGPQTTTASAAGLKGSPVTFEATATEGPPAGGIAITNNPPTSALNGEVFAPAAQPAVRVTDGSGPVADVQVSATVASGGGTLQGKTTATTDANGDAVFGDLGISGTGAQTLEFTAGTATVQSAPVTISALSPKATTGEWGPVVPWDIVPLQITQLPNGKIFAWGKRDVADSMGMPRVWDPAQGDPSTATMIDVNEMLFCAGHTLMADGTLMIAGGHHMDDRGIKVTYFYGPNGSFTKGPDMMFGRWYPTLTTLPNGDVLTMAGRDETGEVIRTPELWNGSSWAQLTGAGPLEIPYYPRNFVDPRRAAQVFYAGERVLSRWFSYAGSGSWSPGPEHIWKFNRDYGTAVMYDTGKILYAGGGGDTGWNTPDPKSGVPTDIAEKIDLNQATPSWQSAGTMSSPRRHLNSTVLPDGEVLVTGGLSAGGFNTLSSAVKTAEIWNPETNQWTTLAAASVARGYHSVSLLLPDGTVLHGASGDAGIPGGNGAIYPPERNHEIFSPPYLFKGTRPTIASAPATVGYGDAFTVSTPFAAQVAQVRWIRLGSVTHAFDMNQRANTLGFTAGAGSIQVTAPSGPNLAPPGHYLLFILNRNGVPSVGKVVKIQ
jgi:WD40 repeat protein